MSDAGRTEKNNSPPSSPVRSFLEAYAESSADSNADEEVNSVLPPENKDGLSQRQEASRCANELLRPRSAHMNPLPTRAASPLEVKTRFPIDDQLCSGEKCNSKIQNHTSTNTDTLKGSGAHSKKATVENPSIKTFPRHTNTDADEVLCRDEWHSIPVTRPRPVRSLLGEQYSRTFTANILDVFCATAARVIHVRVNYTNAADVNKELHQSHRQAAGDREKDIQSMDGAKPIDSFKTSQERKSTVAEGISKSAFMKDIEFTAISKKREENAPVPDGSGEKCHLNHQETNFEPNNDMYNLMGRSLMIFRPDHPFRLECAKILINRYFELFLFIVLMFQWVVYLLDEYVKGDPDRDTVFSGNNDKNIFGDNWLDWALLCIFTIYTVELILRSVVFGFVINPAYDVEGLPTFSHTNTAQFGTSKATKNPAAGATGLTHDAFLRHTFNRVDFFCVVAYWVDIYLMISGRNGSNLCKAIAASRPLRFLALTEGLLTILQSLKKSAPLLLNVMVFISFFFLLFGILGVQAFRGSLSRRCVFLNATNPESSQVVAPSRTCGGYYIDAERQTALGEYEPAHKTDALLGAKGFICDFGQHCIAMGRPADHFETFDNIVVSLMTVFTVVTMEKYTALMYLIMDAEYGISALYFVTITLVMSFVMVQLFIAVITETFCKIREETKHSAFSEKEDLHMLTENADDGEWDICDVNGDKVERLPTNVEDGTEKDFKSGISRKVLNFFYAPVRRETRKNRSISQARICNMPVWILLRIWDFAAAVVSASAFRWMGRLCVAASILIQASSTATDTPEKRACIDFCESLFTAYFAIEIGLRLLVIPRLHPRRTLFSKRSDRVDFILAIATVALQVLNVEDEPYYRYLTIVQVARSYRLVKAVPSVDRLMTTVLGSLTGLANVVLFLFITFVVIAPICTQFLGGDFVDEKLPEDLEGDSGGMGGFTFDDAAQSALALFDILIGDDWQDVMYLSIRSQQYAGIVNMVVAGLIMIIMYCFTHWIILSLLVAVVLENFEFDEDQKRSMQLKNFLKAGQSYGLQKRDETLAMLNPYTYFQSKHTLVKVDGFPSSLVPSIRQTAFQSFIAENKRAEECEIGKSPRYVALTAWRKASAFCHKLMQKPRRLVTSHSTSEPTTMQRRPSTVLHTEIPVGTGSNVDTAVGMVDDASDPGTRPKEDIAEAYPAYERSLFLFWPDNQLRKWCQTLTGLHPDRSPDSINYFNLLVFTCVCASVILTIYDSPYRRHKRLIATGDSGCPVVTILNTLFLSTFTAEFLLKVMAEGFLFTPRGYLRDAWNRLDLFVLITYFIAEIPMFGTGGEAGISRALRATKALRPLRLISYFKGVQEIFNTWIQLLPRILDVAIFSVMLIVPFGIYGMNLFSGFFARCNDDGLDINACIGEYEQSLNTESNITSIFAPRVYANPGYDFDSIGGAILSIFEMASTEGWSDVMFVGMSVPDEIGGAAEYNRNLPQWYNSIFFAMVMLFCSVFIIQLFIGVIVANFVTRSGQALLTLEQRRWVDLQRQLKLIKPAYRPARPTSRFRAWCHDLVADKRGKFNKTVTMVILVNIFVMTLEYQQPPRWQRPNTIEEVAAAPTEANYGWILSLADIAYAICTAIYVFDIVVKVAGLGWKKWTSNRWNVYDAIVTAIGALAIISRGIIYSVTVTKGVNVSQMNLCAGWIFQIQKFSHVAIGVRVVQRIDTLQTLFRAIINTLPSIMNIGTVFVLVLLTYALAFMEIFGLVRLGPNTDNHANVRSLDNSLLLMIRMTTGEAWNSVMKDFMVESPNCVIDESNYLLTDCGGKEWAYIIFTSFYVICTYIFLNMFIVVVIDNFSFAYQQDIAFSLITRDDLRDFKRAWTEFDTKGTGFISCSDLPKFFRNLGGRFEVKVYRDNYTLQTLKELGLRGRFHRKNSNLSERESSSMKNESSDQMRDNTNDSCFSVRSLGFSQEFDFELVEDRLSELDIETIRERKRWLNFVHYDAHSMAVQGKGISFRDLLHVLSYKLVDVDSSLKLDDLIQRQEKVEEINEKIAEERVQGTFCTILQRRKYLRMLQERKNSANGHSSVPKIVFDAVTEQTENQYNLNGSRRSYTSSTSSTSKDTSFSGIRPA